MKFTRTVTSLGTLAAATACAAIAIAAPAEASAQTFKDHETFSPVGDVFTCTGGNLTVTGGTISQAIEGVMDGQGVFHITGTIVPHGVTLTDGTNSYTITGADWFGGKSLDPDGNLTIVSTDTEHFVIRSASGGLYAKVQLVEHMSPNGNSFSFDRGSCETPND
jgi:hypothetical protein